MFAREFQETLEKDNNPSELIILKVISSFSDKIAFHLADEIAVFIMFDDGTMFFISDKEMLSTNCQHERCGGAFLDIIAVRSPAIIQELVSKAQEHFTDFTNSTDHMYH